MKWKIGLTGGIGSGKSTVAQILECMGYPVFYADIAARELMDSDPSVRSALLSCLGNEFLIDDRWNRPKLASEIFSNDARREAVNAIIHPAVRNQFDLFFHTKRTQLVFQEAAILFETGGYKQMHENILVTAPEQLRIERVMKRDQCSQEDVMLRMKRQMSDDDKRKHPHIEVINDNSTPLLEQIELCVDGLLQKLEAIVS
jgi:dephospho-CoA kinase